MAVTKTVIKNTHQESIVKVAGTAASATIDLQTDILPTAQALDGDTQTVNIVGVMWSGATGGQVQITRNGTIVKTMVTDAADYHDYSGQDMCPETTDNTSDIVVTISGAQAECWLKLRKVGGYKSKSGEYPQYGAYEDETRVGASTTISGSPDKV